MPDGSITTRLDRIEQKQIEMLVTLKALEDGQAAERETLEDVVAELGGAPPRETRGNRQTVRDSIHELRGWCAPVAMEAAFRRVLNEKRATYWTRWQKGITVTGVIVGSLAAVLRLAGVGG